MKEPAWLEGLTTNDWYLDGSPIRGKGALARWDKLDWSRARMDMGPSPAGNPGPYWHVPWDFEGEELWARLYPKIVLTKWQPLIEHAISQAKPT